MPHMFRAYFATLEEQHWPAPPDNPFHNCFGCGPGHPTGLRVRCFKTDEGIASPILIPRQYEGPPGAAHGGIVAAYLDEVLGAAVVRATGRVAVTGELTVRDVEPVPTETPIVGPGSVVGGRRRYVAGQGPPYELRTKRPLAPGRGPGFPGPNSRARGPCR